ncbi:MAG: hypothetical protein F6K48_04290 [Okeania sp. SIO3H1]|nr:hypothetical protein [Okeania sp. SIO3H1]
MINNFIKSLISFFNAIGTVGIGIFGFVGGLVSGLGRYLREGTDFLIGLAVIGAFIYAVIVLRSKEGTLETKATKIAVVFSAVFAGIMTGSQLSNNNLSNDDNVSTILIYLADIYIR